MNSLFCVILAGAVAFGEFFSDSTLRLDYVLTGTNRTAQVALADMQKHAGWAGRRHRLDEVPLEGNAQVQVRDRASGQLIYMHSFSTLFQEWQHEQEALERSRAFEVTYQIPLPKRPVDVSVVLFDMHRKEVERFTHGVDPEDMLIRQTRVTPQEQYRYLWLGHDTLDVAGCVDVAIVAEGYRSDEMGKFYGDAQRVVDSLFAYAPYNELKRHFNVVAVATPSEESGVAIPRRGIWPRTFCGSHFDSFYMDRYLTTTQLWNIYDGLGTLPAEVVVVLCNTEKYGGSGIYNELTITAADNSKWAEVTVHEFSHGFAGLADEYAAAYDTQTEDWYPGDTEPWEPNITTLVDFGSKWADMVPRRTPVPTPERKDMSTQIVGAYEGAGYQAKGCYRPAMACQMRVRGADGFCPVCVRAIRRMVGFLVES